MSEWWEERTIGQKIAMVAGFTVLGAGALFLFGLVVMWLWNWLMPEIFGLPEITYWQGWGLLLLSCILFKNVGSGSNESSRSDRKRKRKLREYMAEPAEETASATPAANGPLAEADPAPEASSPDSEPKDEQER